MSIFSISILFIGYWICVVIYFMGMRYFCRLDEFTETMRPHKNIAPYKSNDHLYYMLVQQFTNFIIA